MRLAGVRRPAPRAGGYTPDHRAGKGRLGEPPPEAAARRRGVGNATSGANARSTAVAGDPSTMAPSRAGRVPAQGAVGTTGVAAVQPGRGLARAGR